jgi:hypothetical protein
LSPAAAAHDKSTVAGDPAGDAQMMPGMASNANTAAYAISQRAIVSQAEQTKGRPESFRKGIRDGRFNS